MSYRRLSFAVLCACCGQLAVGPTARAAAPSLCLLIPESKPIIGQRLSVRIELGDGDIDISGGQFSIEYNPIALGYFGAKSGTACDPASPFSLLPQVSVDEIRGVITMAVSVAILAPTTQGPATMACLEFVPLSRNSSDVCLVDRVSSPTFLIDADSEPLDPSNAGVCPAVIPRIACDTVEDPRPNECSVLDSDADGDIDLVDFAVFQRCLTGPGVVDPEQDDPPRASRRNMSD